MYLKGFARADGKVYTYRILVSHPNVPVWVPKSTKAIAKHAHLYTSSIGGVDSDRFEKWLDQEFEAPAAESLNKATSDAKMKTGDWNKLVRFTAAQFVRTPANLLRSQERWVESVPEALTSTLETTVRMMEAKRAGRPLPEPVFSKTGAAPIPLQVSIEPSETPGVVKLKPEIPSGRGMWLFYMEHILTNTIKYLEAHDWTILRPASGLQWLTSDDPVICVNYYRQGLYDFDGGWGKNGCELLFPLGPQHLLHTRVGQPRLGRGTVIAGPVAEIIRRLIAEHAFRMIFAATPDDGVLSIRPRVVNDVQFRDEERQWKEWHEFQSKAETEATGLIVHAALRK
jgi:hypothetical protein